MRRRSELLAVSVVAALLVPAGIVGRAAPSASAEPGRTSPCTIVGTARADHLVGTSGPDVICGRGGGDVLKGSGGDDLLVGGRGRDRVDGGAGDDVVKGGPGADHLVGALGADRLLGGAADDVAGAGPGADVVLGGAGDDDLGGGADADRIDGGEGTNWCTLDAADTATRCVDDVAPPAVHRVLFSSDAVDVTADDREVTVRVHLTDDTGVTSVVVRPGSDTNWFPSSLARLRSGSVRDGWWQARLKFRRYSIPGSYRPVVMVNDRADHEAFFDTSPASLEVRDDRPDLDLPDVTLLSPTPSETFETGAQGVVIPLRARIHDELSGAVDIGFCLVQGAVQETRCYKRELVSGDNHDGIWSSSAFLPANAAGATWNVVVTATDRAHRGTQRRVRWSGPAEYAAHTADAYEARLLPNDMGAIEVIGAYNIDNRAPDVTELTVTPGPVDTGTGPATIDLTAQAFDSNTGVGGVYVELRPRTDGVTTPPLFHRFLPRTAGTDDNGTWSGSITLPRGTAPGSYYVHAFAWDEAYNARPYVSSSEAGRWTNSTPLANDPTVTVVDSTAP